MSPQFPRRFLVLVIDGLGVGEMDDVASTRPQDRGAHTLRHVLAHGAGTRLPTLESIGAIRYFLSGIFAPVPYRDIPVSFGKCRLAHFGADTYAGHQELAGTIPKPPVRQFVREVRPTLQSALEAAGFSVRWTGKYLVVDDVIAIADNIETDYGLNINVVGCLDRVDFDAIVRVGQTVRTQVQVGRIITMGGVGITPKDFDRCLEIKERDGYTAWGINIPALNIYNEQYRVIHIGFGVNPEVQVTQILVRRGIPVVLIGKAADFIRADNAVYHPEVLTPLVLEEALRHFRRLERGFIFANAQETDLAGHRQDTPRYADLLVRIDAFLPRILEQMGPEDVLLVTGDHGNDPTIGHTNHTRERTPVIVFSRNFSSRHLGERATLADVGATVAKYFGAPLPESGTPMFG
ncbi:MAG: phosphopentomutase [Patescibacteria group bacterium]|nr:phosphopentomutase [Patescibacteria group bacterium]